MARPIISSHGLELYQATDEDVGSLLASLSKENVREIDELYQTTPELLFDRLMGGEMIHSVKMNGEVVAISGIIEGVMWSMFSKKIRKHWRLFVKASPDLVQFYHYFYPTLHCQVWSENVFVHNWLIHLGFVPDSLMTDHNENVPGDFVRCNSPTSGIFSPLSRPGMH